MHSGRSDMSTRIDDFVLSQLADGELPHDETVGALLLALQDEESRSRLRQHLQLRQMSAAWRAQRPSANLIPAVPAAALRPMRPAENGFPRGRHLQSSSVMVASVMGGLLVLLGVWVGKSSHGPVTAIVPAPRPSEFVVSPGQRQQIAQVFAFHESVAGPLKCFAADDQEIEVTPADAELKDARPLAVVLRLTAEGSPRPLSREYVIGCRQGGHVATSVPDGDGRLP